MTPLLPEQVDALRELGDVCEALAIDIVVIGATALRVWIPDAQRLTEDVDVAVALDLDAFGLLTGRLTDLGWHPDSRWEPRWHSRGHARVDLLPVGLRARKDEQIRWPRAETVMRVVGYDGVFRQAVFCELAAGLEMRVAPLHVLALLKLVAYLDAPALREKDLGDLRLILYKYEESGDRRFSDDVLDAGIQYDEAGALLLGHDLRTVCVTTEETDAVRQFLQRVMDRDFQFPVHVLHRRSAGDGARENLDKLFGAFTLGFGAKT